MNEQKRSRLEEVGDDGELSLLTEEETPVHDHSEDREEPEKRKRKQSDYQRIKAMVMPLLHSPDEAVRDGAEELMKHTVSHAALTERRDELNKKAMLGMLKAFSFALIEIILIGNLIEFPQNAEWVRAVCIALVGILCMISGWKTGRVIMTDKSQATIRSNHEAMSVLCEYLDLPISERDYKHLDEVMQRENQRRWLVAEERRYMVGYIDQTKRQLYIRE